MGYQDSVLHLAGRPIRRTRPRPTKRMIQTCCPVGRRHRQRAGRGVVIDVRGLYDVEVRVVGM